MSGPRFSAPQLRLTLRLASSLAGLPLIASCADSASPSDPAATTVEAGSSAVSAGNSSLNEAPQESAGQTSGGSNGNTNQPNPMGGSSAAGSAGAPPAQGGAVNRAGAETGGAGTADQETAGMAPEPISGAGGSSGGTGPENPTDAGASADAGEIEPPPAGTRFVFTVNMEGDVRAFSFDSEGGLAPFAEITVEDSQDFPTDRFLAVDAPSQRVFVAGTGALTALSFDPEQAEFQVIDTGTTAGGGTHVSVSGDGSTLFVAHYSEGALSVVNFDGSFSAHQAFQSGMRAHSSLPHPSAPWLYVPCLGSNYVAQYTVPSSGTDLTPLSPETRPAEGGPRHMALHPNGEIAYLLTELSGEVRAFPIDSATGALGDAMDTERLTDAAGDQWGSDIHITADGAHLYAIERNQQSMFHFDVATDGSLESSGSPTSLGAVVRSFRIDPSDAFLFAGDQDGKLTAYAIDAQTGDLSVQGTPISGLGTVHATAVDYF